MLGRVFDAFVQETPISVMLRGLMESVFNPERIDAIFDHHAQVQYTRELLFSDVVNVLSLVVCGIHPSVNAAYKAKAEDLNIERSAFYRKLNGVETDVSAALLRDTASELEQLISRVTRVPDRKPPREHKKNSRPMAATMTVCWKSC